MRIRKLILLILISIPINIYAQTTAPIDITTMSMEEISTALDNNIITSKQLVNIYLERIDAYKDYNAIISINENALTQAEELDKERANGKVRSSIHGIPIIVKDNIDVLGMPTTSGTKSLKDNYPKQNADVIQKLIDAGAIIIAKANMSELAFYASSSKSSYGTVKNAYNLDYSPYGSSGGSAVAVAASLASAALGTDTNSSVRLPAAANNLVGYRPTYGLFSNQGVLPYDPNRDTVGTLTKTLNDSIILTNIMSLNNTKIKTNLSNLKEITIGVPTLFLDGSESSNLTENKKGYSEITKMAKKVISLLEKNGAKIVYLDEYFTNTQNYYVNNSYSGYLFCNAVNNYLKGTTGSIRTFEELAKSNGKITNIDTYLKYCGTSNELKDNKKTIITNYDVYLNNIYKSNDLDAIIYPTTKNQLLKVDKSGIVNIAAHASPAVGYPSITMPLGFDQDNLPYGIEFMSLKGDDNLLLNIAGVYEKINNQSKHAPTIAPSLYSVDNQTQKLVKKYLKLNNEEDNNFIKTKWLNKVKNYFKQYNNVKDHSSSSKKLNINYIITIILSTMYNIFKIILIIILIIYILLILTKTAIKKLKPKKKRRNHK